MEFLTSPPAGGLPPAVNQYRARAIIKLYPPSADHPAGVGGPGGGGSPGMVRRRSSLGATTSGDEGGGGLRRILSRGSGGGGAAARRDSSGGAAAATEGGDEPSGGGGGGGLRRILSRGGGGHQGQDTSAVVLDSETNNTNQGQGQGGAGAALGRVRSREVVTGKWTAKVAVGTTKTHLVLILSPGETLQPTDGVVGTHAGDDKAKTGDATEHGETASGGGGGGIGGKILSLFGARKGSFSKSSTTSTPSSPTNATHEGATTTTTDTTTAATVGNNNGGAPSAIGSEATAVEPSIAPQQSHERSIIGVGNFPGAPMAQQHSTHDRGIIGVGGGTGGAAAASGGGFPSHVAGTPVSYVTIPLVAIQQEGMKAIEVNKAGDVVLRVPVESHFSKFVHPMLEDLGRNHDDSWGRSGTIKFVFSGKWIGAKGEAEVLQHNIEQALLHNTQAMTA